MSRYDSDELDALHFKPIDPDERGKLAPGAELVESPLEPGGGPGEPGSTRSLPELLSVPQSDRHPRGGRASLRRRRLLARRKAARDRFREISDKSATSQSRVLEGLRRRGGLLERARRGAVHRRFNFRGR